MGNKCSYNVNKRLPLKEYMDFNNAYHLITDKLLSWARDIIKLLPNIALAVIILIVGVLIARWLKKLIKKLIGRFVQNQTLEHLFASMSYIVFVGITIFIALSVLKLDKAVTSILAGAGILGLTIAFAFQDIAANFMSGILISVRKPLHVNDTVKIQDYMGEVDEINLRDVVIRTYQGQMVIIPNKQIFQNPIENFTLLGKRRVDLEVGISYGEDLERVKEITLASVKDIDGLSKTDEVTMFYTSFGDSSINYVIRLWVSNTQQPDFLEVKSQAIIRIKKAYDKHNIMIPFPIRTLDFGIKGGVPLNEVTQNPA